jgi:ferrous iron transport protein B
MMDEARRRGIKSILKNYLSVWVYLSLKQLLCVIRVLKIYYVLDQEKYSATYRTEWFNWDSSSKIEMIFKDVVHYVDQEDKRTDFLDKNFLTSSFGST